MSAIPPNECTLNDLFEWYRIQDELKRLKAQEMILRVKLFKHHFKDPKEGTNDLELGPLLTAANIPDDGRVLKGGHVINRSVDEAALLVLAPTFAEKKLPVDKLIKRKPELVIGEYRKLTKEEQLLFDQALVIKPGTPSLEVVLPAKRVAKA
jgi:hypothetical protein